MAVVIGTIIGAGVLLVALLIVFLCVRKGYPSKGHERKKPRNGSSKPHRTRPPELHLTTPPCKVYSLAELVEATVNFNEGNKLGEGGFGSVYKGKLKNDHQIAVKRLKQYSHQGDREFSVEVETISRVKHKHLATMSGCCMESGERIIVYDFCPNKSLMAHLYAPYSANHSLTWSRRMRIAIGAADGIRYLHEEAKPKIIHRDIKASNILLDAEFEALVSDFGLAKLVPAGATHVTTRVKGTLGYLAPEYARTGQVSEKSDVYSFGVLLFELISGRKPIMRGGPQGNRITLVEWVAPLLDKRRLSELLDRRLASTVKDDELYRLITVASLCVQQYPAARPTMRAVYSKLSGTPTEVPKPIKKAEPVDGPLPIAKVDYGSAIYEEDIESGREDDQNAPGTHSADVNRSQAALLVSPSTATVSPDSPRRRAVSPIKVTPSIPVRATPYSSSVGTMPLLGLSQHPPVPPV
ncbi:hypothetical protein CBR_g24129 [Chara braunii]|uniref:Protein kinase domain-containing protein n=1 Tax=Chara braunii TaxID=69332 RepID=A0A388L652_CHABU|nr:hypothetical protein CBR_g24129 [Chara braunii]|eukprot:GBG77683.1 hypothetical protein CBR_g24129 [Chara braunii]